MYVVHNYTDRGAFSVLLLVEVCVREEEARETRKTAKQQATTTVLATQMRERGMEGIGVLRAG